ncbi:hypothetical protein [Oleidesulfovibrio alaskensis]|jgi:cation transport ATPase|uniref:hypothetical protein n=1 Tax=Oleidesulfovibrio alaskensis TaxID=58180 RepID=UPI001A49D273|nr:hypothetical protein [Oleidesulfovibrio alaskensis]MBL3582314.1 hypothetical protein [Oleidesulfovibrio alaskensis]
METPDLRHWILFWSGLAAQIPFLWFLVRISFTGRYSSTSARLKARFACAVAGAAACCVFAALEQDQLLFWGQAAAIMCYIKLAQHQSRNEQKK